VRTTLTFDDDVASLLKAEVRRSGTPLDQVVNERLRLSFASRPNPKLEPPFVIRPRDLGALRPGLSLDSTGALLESAEGPAHR
jgi:hypothetical protein